MTNTIHLRPSDISTGWRGFQGRLRKRGFPPQFIEDFGEELFAEGQLEVTRMIARGAHVYEPRGLLIHCAWRRTQNLLEKRSRTPQNVTLVAVAEQASEQAAPDEQVIDDDQGQRLREA